jgi:hypothetical protein
MKSELEIKKHDKNGYRRHNNACFPEVCDEQGLFIGGNTSMVSGLGSSLRFTCIPERPDRLWGPQTNIQGVTRVLHKNVKLPSRDVDHLPSSTADIKNEWRYNFTILCTFRRANMNTFMLYCKNITMCCLLCVVLSENEQTHYWSYKVYKS